jgi:hypothetical protein
MLLDDGVRDGVVDKPLPTSSDSCERKALRQLIVRGTPLKPMHFKPTSRINSAFCTASARGRSALAKEWRAESDWGEFIVIVAAVCTSGQWNGPMHLDVYSASYAHRKPCWPLNFLLFGLPCDALVDGRDAFGCWRRARSRKWRVNELFQRRRKL